MIMDIKKSSTSLAIRVMQIKTTVRFHFTSIKMVTNKEIITSVGKDVKKHHTPCSWECKSVQPLWKTIWKFLKILRIELAYGPAIPLLSIFLKNMNT